MVGPPDGVGIAAHDYGALIQIFPREAYALTGGMDPRFRGWGGDDLSNVLALDTLFGAHRLTRNIVLMLWHAELFAPEIQIRRGKLRVWLGQDDPRSSYDLALRYQRASGDPAAMRALIDEWQSDSRFTPDRIEAEAA
jgi:hypothetical protein